jgi:hypothetical protein
MRKTMILKIYTIKAIQSIILTIPPPHTPTPFAHHKKYHQKAVGFEQVCKRNSTLVTHLVVALKRMCYTACGATQPNVKTKKRVEDKEASSAVQKAK